jgi:hypothetical protein
MYYTSVVVTHLHIYDSGPDDGPQFRLVSLLGVVCACMRAHACVCVAPVCRGIHTTTCAQK